MNEEMVLKFSCGKCKMVWNSTEKTVLVESSKPRMGKIHTTTEAERDGYNCPNCKSDDVSGVEIKS